jgi:putative ABC transport system permease protein
MQRVLAFITLRQWALHKLRIALTLLGMALGVAVFFAVRTANNSLFDSLNKTVETLAGKSTLQITAGEAGIPSNILQVVRSTPGVIVAEPTLEITANTAFPDEGNLLVVGIDILGDQRLRDYQFDKSQTTISNPLALITQPDSILISRSFADRHRLKEGDKLPLFTSLGKKELTVRGLFKPSGVGEVFGGQVAVMNIYAAQNLFGRGDNFDRIDVMTNPGVPIETVQQSLRARLPSGIIAERPAARGKSLENAFAAMSQGFMISSMVALLVGVFLIYNTFAIAVNQRWREIGVLRSLGVEQGAIQRMFLGEAAFVGVVGSLLGIVGGYYLAKAAALVMSSIAAKTYGLLTTNETPIFRMDYALQALVLGVLAAFVAAWLPARAASKLNPVLALHHIETRQREAVLGRSRIILGLALILLGLLLIRFTTAHVGSLYQFGYAGLGLLGFILLLPSLSSWSAYLLRPIMDRFFGAEGLLALDSMIASPRRTSATVGALTIGLSFVFATHALTEGEKKTILGSFDKVVNSGVIIANSDMARSRSSHLPESLGAEIAALPGIKRIEQVRFTFVPYRKDEAAIVALEMEGWFARVTDPLVAGDEAKARDLMPKGQGVMISSNFASRWGVGVGDTIQLDTPTGPFQQPIIGIIEDYSSEKGTILMDRALYKRYWRDSAVDFIDLNLKPGVDRVALRSQIQRRLAGRYRAFVYTNAEYKQWINKLIDQFFTLNNMQLFVAVLVAAIGIVNTLIISVMERKREIGVIRAIGGLRGQIRKMVLLEAVAIAVVGVGTGALKGLFDAYFLTKTASAAIVGYTIPFTYPVLMIVQSVPIVIVVALLAAWWPAARAAKQPIVEAIGYE